MIFSAKEVVNNVLVGNQEIKPIDSKTLQGLQDVLCEILVDIMKCCDELGINVALCGGSCLGAVRHSGFIPWDDDLDIAFTREEWEIFKKGFERHLGVKYEMGAPGYNNKDCCFPWASIYLKDSELIGWLNLGMPYPKKIFVDVFVIENVSSFGLVRWFDGLMSPVFKYVATSMLFYRYPNPLMREIFSSTLKTRCYLIFRQMLGFVFSFVSHKTWVNLYDRFISRHNGESSLVTIPNGSRRYNGEMLQRDIFFPYSKGLFCGIHVLLPHNPDAYLRNMYGANYMELPPIEKRDTHHIVTVKLPQRIMDNSRVYEEKEV